MTTAEAITRRLEAHGVRHVFGIPGTHNLSLYRHLAASSITHVVGRHEQGLGYAADGYARSSGRPAVCLTTTGPALLNAVAAIGTAWADSVPMVVLSPGLPGHVEGRDTGFLHESRAQSRLMAELVGQSFRASGPADAVALVDAAFASFVTRRPRPFHIEVPLDLMDAEAPLELEPPTRLTSAPGPAPHAVARVAAMLADAERGAVVVGGGAVGASSEVVELARRLQLPVVSTVNGKGVFPETDESLSLGASIRLRSCHELLRTADVVLAVGTELAESDIWRDPPLELEGDLIRIDIDPSQLNKNARASLALVADARIALEAILGLLADAEVRDRGAERARALRPGIVQEALVDGAPFTELVRALETSLTPDTVIAGDAAMACYYGVAHLLAQDAPRRFLFPTGFATLGYGLPAGIGAALAQPERPVVVLMGDGGALFTISELATAVELGLRLPIVIVNNGGYGEIRRMMVERDQPVLGADLETPDFAALARSFGAAGERTDDVAALPGLLRAAQGRSGPSLIELRLPDR